MLLKDLTQANGVSGNEKEVRDIIIKEIEKYCDKIDIDYMGNIIAYKKGNSNSNKKIMLSAHMDEVGFIVTSITDSGYIKFKNVGGIDVRILPSQKVLIGNKKIPGVIGLKAIHLQNKDERSQIKKVKDLYIDIGAKDKDDALKNVVIGDYIAFDSKYIEFGNGLVKTKALDDRVGCMVLIEMLKQTYNFDLYACFTVQEEVGLRGAAVAAYTVNPDVGLVIEGTICSDVSGVEDHESSTILGNGPALSILDRTTYFDKELSKFLIELAKDNNIDIQYRRATSGGNDGGRIHLTHEGVRTTALSVPCRYIHSPVSVMNLNDFEKCKKLVSLFLNEVEKMEVMQ